MSVGFNFSVGGGSPVPPLPRNGEPRKGKAQNSSAEFFANFFALNSEKQAEKLQEIFDSYHARMDEGQKFVDRSNRLRGTRSELQRVGDQQDSECTKLRNEWDWYDSIEKKIDDGTYNGEPLDYKQSVVEEQSSQDDFQPINDSFAKFFEGHESSDFDAFLGVFRSLSRSHQESFLEGGLQRSSIGVTVLESVQKNAEHQERCIEITQSTNASREDILKTLREKNAWKREQVERKLQIYRFFQGRIALPTPEQMSSFAKVSGIALAGLAFFFFLYLAIQTLYSQNQRIRYSNF